MRFPKIALAVVVSAASMFAQGSAKLKAEYLANFDDTAKKFISLAEKVPADKYSYKPGEGVRTIGQVFVHIVGANAFGSNSFGLPATDIKLSRDMEKTLTDKAEIVTLLKKVMEHSRKAIEMGMDAQEKETKLFGRAMSNAGAALTLITHMHEHLGQSIAYARGAGVTPPWSAN
jgi:uncharacterized damage-inducible protein DinB